MSKIKSFFWNKKGEQHMFGELEKFIDKSHILKANSFDDFTRIKFDEKRFLLIIVMKILSFIFFIRCILNIVWPTAYIRDLTCNAYHYLGDPVLINLVFLGGVTTVNILIGLFYQYFNLSGQSYQCKYMSKVKHQTFDFKLKGRFADKYFRYFKLISKGVSTQFLPICLAMAFIFCSPTLIGYYDPELNFSLMGKLFFLHLL